MATFTDANAFANHVRSYGKAVDAAQKEAVTVTARAATALVKSAGERYHIKGRRKAAVRLSAKSASVSAQVAVVSATPPGAWKLIEEGAKPHEIKPRRQGRGGRRSAVVVPGRGIFAHVHHPGTGSIGHPWEQAMTAVERRCPDVFADAVVAGTLSRVV